MRGPGGAFICSKRTFETKEKATSKENQTNSREAGEEIKKEKSGTGHSNTSVLTT